MLTAPKPYINEKEIPSQGDSSNSGVLQENTDTWISFLTPKYKPETTPKSEFPSSGTIEFKWVEPEIKQIEPEPSSRNQFFSLAKSAPENSFSTASRTVKFGWSLLKDLFDGLFSIIRLSSEPILTPEQQKAKEERQKKEQERKANIKAFYEALKINLTKFNEQKYKIRLENRQRLGITNLDIATTNQLLSGENGPMRNLSDTDISYDYHDEHAAIAMVEKRRADQAKQAAKELVSPAKKLSKGPRLIMDMDKQHLSKGGTVTTAGG